MPGVHSSNCPYCFTNNVAFVAAHDFQVVGGGFRSLMKCGRCGEGVIWEYLPPKPGSHPGQVQGDISRHYILVSRQWPLAVDGEAPADVPLNVAAFFRQATSSLHSASFDAAGMMFRKTIESAIKAIDSELARMSLRDRIKKLSERGLITPALGEWANEVRLGGNEAAHEDELFTKEDAQALHDFAENFLRYAFTLPAAVARRTAPIVKRIDA